MKIQVKSFKIVCDCCGETFRDGNDFVCFTDDTDGGLIRDEAISSDWLEIGDRHYCPECYHIDDDDHIVTKDGHVYDYDTREEIKEK